MRFFIFINIFCSSLVANGQLYCTAIETNKLVYNVFVAKNAGVKIKNINFNGADEAMAYFSTAHEFLPIKKGLVLSTGNAKQISQSNSMPNSGCENYTPGDPDLSKLINAKTYDAAILNFDFYPNSDKISFQYFFASEEYPEYINKGLNDVFAFFIREKGEKIYHNIAVLPESNLPVSVDNINAAQNANLFISNDIWDKQQVSKYANNIMAGERSLYFTFDGLTRVLMAEYNVVPYTCYEFKIAIADVGDAIFDSGVFLQKHSFKSDGELLAIKELKNDTLMCDLKSYIIHERANDDSLEFSIPFEFEFNSDEYSQDYHKVLISLYALLEKYFDMRICLIGHADCVGNEGYNVELSIKRAQKIATLLSEKGIDENRIAVVGKGSSQPISYKNQNKNRRVQCMFFR